jgi:hypothetical protein
VLVTPGANWPEDDLAFTVSNDGDSSRFVLSVCNVTAKEVTGFQVGFRYLVIDLP